MMSRNSKTDPGQPCSSNGQGAGPRPGTCRKRKSTSNSVVRLNFPGPMYRELLIRRGKGSSAGISYAYGAMATASLSKAYCWSAVGRASMTIGGASPRRTILRVRVARSCSKVRKLCTGRPSARVCERLCAGRGGDLGGSRVRVGLRWRPGGRDRRTRARRRTAALPDNVIGQHAEKDMGLHPGWPLPPAYWDRPDCLRTPRSPPGSHRKIA
jgi:hypothetical protein